MNSSHDILGVRVDDIPDAELEQRLNDMLVSARANIVVTPNAEFILSARDDAEFRGILKSADLSLPDGVSIKYAVAALTDDEALIHRHTGVDTLQLLARLSAESGKRMLILGGTGKDPEIVGGEFKKLYPTLDIVALDPGIIDDEVPRLSEAVASRVKSLEPVIIAVALGQGRGRRQGKQERVMAFLAEEISTARILIGVGGAIRTLAHPSLIPPLAWRKRGVESLWRLIKQPWRSPRIFRAVIVFPAVVVWECIGRRRLLKAAKRVYSELF
ncbi:MAG: WecB/TagA/CpsF family glycosyltransferase [Patescibacteria group bacterium]|jgi:N-acetylglucosaminyldiphosphoundecaprenol N-acetyl-beta-D-mannosaminyltransferase